MPFLGNFVNCLAVVVGGVLGMSFKRGISGRMQTALIQAIGLCVVFIGGSGALQHMFVATAAADGSVTFSVEGTMLLIASMVLGTLVGQAADIEGKLEHLGESLKTKLAKSSDNPRFTEGFVTTTLMICVGAMAVVGSISDGMGDPSTLFAKAALDFVIVVVFASAMGSGVILSAVPLFLYQSIFELIGIFAGNVMPDTMVNGIALVGNVLIFAVGLNQLFGNIKGFHIPLGNMLPAILVPVLYDLARMALAATGLVA